MFLVRRAGSRYGGHHRYTIEKTATMLDFALSAFVTLLLVVDPVGLVPAFLAATAGMPEAVKRTLAWRAPLIAASILVVIAPI
jgi:multiple antibiotic resistance protein